MSYNGIDGYAEWPHGVIYMIPSPGRLHTLSRKRRAFCGSTADEEMKDL
jgi:hypothetical protein